MKKAEAIEKYDTTLKLSTYSIIDEYSKYREGGSYRQFLSSRSMKKGEAIEKYDTT